MGVGVEVGYMCMGMWGGGRVGVGGTPGVSGNFRGIPGKIPREFRWSENGKSEISRPQNKIFTNCLNKMKAEIIPDPPVQCLRNGRNCSIDRFLPRTFTPAQVQ